MQTIKIPFKWSNGLVILLWSHYFFSCDKRCRDYFILPSLLHQLAHLTPDLSKISLKLPRMGSWIVFRPTECSRCLVVKPGEASNWSNLTMVPKGSDVHGTHNCNIVRDLPFDFWLAILDVRVVVLIYWTQHAQFFTRTFRKDHHNAHIYRGTKLLRDVSKKGIRKGTGREGRLAIAGPHSSSSSR